MRLLSARALITACIACLSALYFFPGLMVLQQTPLVLPHIRAALNSAVSSAGSILRLHSTSSRIPSTRNNTVAFPSRGPYLNMAWRCSGSSNTELVENLCRSKMITNDRAKQAFLKVDRGHYAPSSAYEDAPQAIGHGATISAPHMHATAVQNLMDYMTPSESRPAPRVLDIGSGSGYLTHLMAELVGDRGLVVGVEHIEELKDLGQRNMAKSPEGRDFLGRGIVKFAVGDGRKGWVEGPREGEEVSGVGWDAIHVGAAAKTVHEELLSQLKAPGRLFIPVDDDEDGWSQHVWNIDKDKDGNISKKRLFGVRYVPLTDAPTR